MSYLSIKIQKLFTYIGYKKGIYWQLIFGITLIHIMEDVLVVTFARFAPMPTWGIYIFTIVASIIMANYAYILAKSKSLTSLVHRKK